MLNVRHQNNVAILTIDRPDKRNALCTELVAMLEDRLRRLNDEPTVAAVVLEGGPPGFCAGSDVRELAGLDRQGACAHEARTAALARSIAMLDKPVVASVSGFAFGGGLFLAASCDHVVTSRMARWGAPEVRLGWFPPWGLAALIGRVGLAAARRLTMTTAEFNGVEAHRLGLADSLADTDGSATTELARTEALRLAALPREAIISTKRFFGQLINREAEMLDQTANSLFKGDLLSQAAVESLARFAGTKK